tara:strand:+ start:30 stop:428 length:399 start_codon:yes stop_codon:yes gene_type:complete
MKIRPLIPIGTKIEVDRSKIENLLPNRLLDDLPQMIHGKIVDYKMTDGMDIGYVLLTENDIKIWVFNSELNKDTRLEYKLEENNNYFDRENSNLLLGKNKITFDINGNKKIKTIANPVNFINWLIFALKDIL